HPPHPPLFPYTTLFRSNPTPYSRTVQTVTAPLIRWASQAPHRIWLAERPHEPTGEGAVGWRTVTYAEAADQVARLASGLAKLGLDRKSTRLNSSHVAIS